MVPKGTVSLLGLLEFNFAGLMPLWSAPIQQHQSTKESGIDIRVIYGVRGILVPHFLVCVLQYPHFSGPEGEEFAVNGDYITIKPFLAGAPSRTSGRAHHMRRLFGSGCIGSEGSPPVGLQDEAPFVGSEDQVPARGGQGTRDKAPP